LKPGSPEWFTDPPDSSEIKFRLSRQANIRWQSAIPHGTLQIKMDPTVRFQEILGIGTSLEETSIHAIKKGKSNDQIDQLLRSLIDPQTGMGFNLFRICIGSSDFSDGRSVSNHPQGFYSYQDDLTDPFSIQADIDLGIIDMIKRVQRVATGLAPTQPIRFFASCWSPPPWMKTSESLIGGTLKSGYERTLARYFRQFIEAYEREGIPIYAITLQNEPNYIPDDYPGMILTPQQQLDITIAVYEEFHLNLNSKKELDTKIWINDHNFEDWVNADYILSNLERMEKKHYVDATAFHNYSDSPPSHMTDLYLKHPQSDIVFTEHSEWGVSGMYNLQQYFWNWSRSYMYWVTMTTSKLDEHNQSPYNNLDELSPTLLIEKVDNPSRWYITPEYFLLSQFSKFIQPGSVRIACDRGSIDSITFVAFKNPDGSVLLIAVNQTYKNQSFVVKYEGRYFQTMLPQKCVGTYRWKEP